MSKNQDTPPPYPRLRQDLCQENGTLAKGWRNICGARKALGSLGSCPAQLQTGAWTHTPSVCPGSAGSPRPGLKEETPGAGGQPGQDWATPGFGATKAAAAKVSPYWPRGLDCGAGELRREGPGHGVPTTGPRAYLALGLVCRAVTS